MGKEQSALFRSIFEFEDPSGTLLAAKIPHSGTADLYDGTVVVVRPSQCCLFVYKGEIAELYMDGTHTLKTGNLPVLTRLASFRLGFKSPLRAELWFFSGQVFTARRWGTAQPVLAALEGQGTVPLRAFGQYSIVLRDPVKFFRSLVGTRSAFDITELEEFVQGQIQELLPLAVKGIKKLEDLSKAQESVSQVLERLLAEKLQPFGLKLVEVQVHALSPGEEVMKALDAKAAMQTIGDPRTYLLYQAAQSLQGGQGGQPNRENDPMQMMLGLMLSKNLLDAPGAQPAAVPRGGKHCVSCGTACTHGQKFCGECGGKL